LIEWSQKLFQKLRTLGELTDVSTDLLAAAPRVKVTINRDQAARASV
jgi:HAE1 family hydrophobic/amphiphilic exporter-1